MEGARNWAVQLLQGPQEAGFRAASQESTAETGLGSTWQRSLTTLDLFGPHIPNQDTFVELNNALLSSSFEVNKTG